MMSSESTIIIQEKDTSYMCSCETDIALCKAFTHQCCCCKLDSKYNILTKLCKARTHICSCKLYYSLIYDECKYSEIKRKLYDILTNNTYGYSISVSEQSLEFKSIYNIMNDFICKINSCVIQTDICNADTHECICDGINNEHIKSFCRSIHDCK
jgi:hypothetical protein